MADQGALTIEITTGHCLGGEGNDVYPGQVLQAPKQLSIADAWKKVRMGYARIVPNPPEGTLGPEASSGPTALTHGDPAIESRDPEVGAPDAAMPPAHRGRPKPGGR